MENVIEINSTARFYTLGEISPEIRAVWFVFHGYGMKASTFINQFNCISDDNTLIVAPEGPHRFYKRGTGGEISAHWMTSELRTFDIQTNISFLNLILERLQDAGLGDDFQLGIIGFSQGCPTSFRWASQLCRAVNLIVAWGSDIPIDVYSDSKRLQKINQSNIKLVIGDRDEYISTERVDEQIITLHENGVNFDFHTFDGGHEIHEETVRYFHARLMNDNLEY